MLHTGRRVGICWCRGGSSGGSFRRVKGKDLCLVVVSFVTALLAFFLFWGEVVVVVVFVAFLVDRVVFASPTAFLSAFFFWAGILLSLSLEFGDPGLNLLVFAMMEIRKEWRRAVSGVDND